MDNQSVSKKGNTDQSLNGSNIIKGNLTFDDKVIQKIVGIALEEVDGLLTVDGGFFSNLAGKIVNTDDVTAGVDVEVGEKQVAVDLDIVAEYGRNITTIFDKIKGIVARELKQMTGLELVELNVNVVDVKTKEQYEKDATTVQDKLSDAAETTSDFVSKQTENAKNVVDKAGNKLSNQASNVKETVEDKKEPRVQ